MSVTVRRWLLALFGVAVSAASLWLLAGWVDLGATADVLARAQPGYLVMAVAVIAAQVMLRSIRWQQLLPVDRAGRRVPLGRIPPVLLAGYLGNAVLPARLGEGLRAYLVSRREGIGLPETLGSVALERVLDTASLAVVAFGAALVVGAPDWLMRGTAVAAVIGVGVIAVMTTIGLRPVVSWLRRVSSSRRGPHLLTRHLPLVERFAVVAGGGERRTAVVLAVGMSTAAWFLDAATFWLVAESLGIELSAAAALLISAITVLGTALPSAPGFIGTFELAAAGVASLLGVTSSDALALAILAHGVTLLPLAVGGAIALAVLGIRTGGAPIPIHREPSQEAG